jgi:predicted MFS family arabinose efflux permease
MFSSLSREVKQYLVVTGNYWAFTLTDGALRMLVVLHFYGLGYSPLQIAMLFLFYEIFGVVTNLTGGWLGARIGLNRTMNIGLFLQVVALAMLLLPAPLLSVVWVMGAQALSGIAKDLNKMSAKSAIKLLVPANQQGKLYHWVAVLTGSKNALKGIGFFMGGALLTLLGFRGAIAAMALALLVVWLLSLLLLKRDLGKASGKAKFSEVFSNSPAINRLALARMFLFGSRDVWFVIALPVFLSQTLGWDSWQTGGFLAAWIILYGIVQALAPRLSRIGSSKSLALPLASASKQQAPGRHNALLAVSALALVPAAIALGLGSALNPGWVIVAGLLVFAVVFAVNSALHSYLIVAHAREDGVSLDVGFYYMANAIGRLIGTVLSGLVFQLAGITACLWISTAMLIAAALATLRLPETSGDSS